MECEATVSVDVVKVACPVPSRVEVPRVEEPFLNVTVPVGPPLPGALAVTAAVKVTGWLNTEGLADELTAEVVPSLFTTWGEAESLPLLLPQPVPPVKVAVTVLLPTASAEVLKAAWPEPFTATFEARTLLPSVKVTVPTGTPLLEVTLAVKVTDCPNEDGLGVEVTVVVVAKALCTVCTMLPLLAAKTKSEAYVAVMVSLPTGSADVLKETVPLLLSGAWVSTVLPCWKVTWPVGVPVAGGTAASVAVKVTDWSLLEGLG